MKLRRWLLATVVVGLVGCGASDDSGTIDGNPINPGGTNGAGTGAGSTGSTGTAPPPTTGGTNPGGTSGGVGGEDGGTDVCEEQMVSSQRLPPDMLIVLDKSGSMGPSGNDQGIDRWGGSVSALKAITADLQKDIKFGLMTYPAAGTSPIPGFPFPGATCGVGMLDVPIAENNAAAIGTALDGMMPSGGTPTSGTLEAARGIMDIPVDVDNPVGPKYVLLVTDGAPNCLNNGAGTDNDPAAVAASVAAIKAMADKGIKTYVIGFQTAQDAALSGSLDQMAVAGATGDTKHRPVEDQGTLITAFRDIAGKAVSCTFLLDKKPPKPEYVLVTVDGKQININDPNGWVLSPDGMQITLQGQACESIQGTGQHTVNVQVKCEPVVPM